MLLKVRQASRKLNKEYQTVNRILRTRQPAISALIPKAKKGTRKPLLAAKAAPLQDLVDLS